MVGLQAPAPSSLARGALDSEKMRRVVTDLQDANVLLPVKRAIATLKRAIFIHAVADKGKDKAEHLQETVRGYNETIHN